MDIEMIPLSQLQMDPQRILSDLCDTGRPLVVQLPDERLVTNQSIEPYDSDDSLVNELLESNAAFRELVAKSKASPRRDFLASCE